MSTDDDRPRRLRADFQPHTGVIQVQRRSETLPGRLPRVVRALFEAKLEGPAELGPWFETPPEPATEVATEALRRPAPEAATEIARATQPRPPSRPRKSRLRALEDARRELEAQARGFTDAPPPRPRRRTPAKPPPVASAAIAATELEVVAVAPAPAEPLPALRTKDVPVELRRSLLAASVPRIDARALRPLVAGLAPEAVSGLDAMLAGQHEAPGSDGSHSPKRALEHLIHESGIGQLEPEPRSILLDAIARAPGDVRSPKAARALIDSGALAELGPQSKLAVCEMFAALDGTARASLALLSARRIHGHIAFNSPDRDGRSLALRLDQLRKTLPNALPSVLSALARPVDLPAELGEAGVCSVLQFALAEHRPAEMPRLLVRAVAEGDEAPLLPHCFAQLPGRTRSGKSGFLAPDGPALAAEVVAEALVDLFDRPYSVVADPNLARARLPSAEQSEFPWLAALRGSEGDERLFVVSGVEDEAVLVSSPKGRAGGALGAVRFDPPRRVIDPEAGLDAIPSDIFWRRFGALFQAS